MPVWADQWRASGVYGVKLSTHLSGSANTPAVTLYKSRGYTETGQLEVAPGVQITRFRRLRAL